MKVLIVYASEHGSTRKAAELLGRHFEDCEIVDLAEDQRDPSGYDAVIFGSGIRFGRIMKPLQLWLDAYWPVIRGMKKGLFICHAIEREAPRILRENFSLELRNGCVAAESFGGEFDEKSLAKKDVLLLKAAKRELLSRGARSFVPCIRTDRIEAFAQKFIEEMETDETVLSKSARRLVPAARQVKRAVQ